MSNNKNLKCFGSSKEGKLGLDQQAKSINPFESAPVLFNNKAMKEAVELMDNSMTGEEDDNSEEEGELEARRHHKLATTRTKPKRRSLHLLPQSYRYRRRSEKNRLWRLSRQHCSYINQARRTRGTRVDAEDVTLFGQSNSGSTSSWLYYG